MLSLMQLNPHLIRQDDDEAPNFHNLLKLHFLTKHFVYESLHDALKAKLKKQIKKIKIKKIH